MKPTEIRTGTKVVTGDLPDGYVPPSASLDPDAAAGLDSTKPLVRIDDAAYRAWLGDRPLRLSRLQFDVLRLLVQSAGKVVSQKTLLRAAWDLEWYGGADKTVQANISMLRRKLGDDAESPRYIETIRGAGFLFLADAVDGHPVEPEVAPDSLDELAALFEEIAERTRRAARLMRGAL